MDQNPNWPQPPLGGTPGGAPGPGMGGMGGPGAPLGDWQPDRAGDADAPAKKKKGFGRGKKGAGKDKKGAEEGATRAVASKRRMFAIALGVLGAAALFLTTSEAPADEVYVAKTTKPVAALNPVTAGVVQGVPQPVETIEGGAFTGSTPEEAVAALLEQYDGKLLRYPLPAGRQIQGDDFLLDAQLGADLGADERLIAIDASIASAVGGDLRVGDRVDVIGVDQQTDLAAMLVTDAEVVDITLPEANYAQVITQQSEESNRDKAADELIPGDPIPGTYTLRVKAVDVPRIYLVAANAQVFLSYRAPGAETFTSGPLSKTAVLCGLDQADLTASYLEALPEACRDANGDVAYGGGSVGAPSSGDDDLFVPED